MSDLYEPCKYWDPFVEQDTPSSAFVSAKFGGSDDGDPEEE